jgi:YcxB-like protein
MDYHFKYSLTGDEFAEFNAYTVWSSPWQKKTRFNFVIRTVLYAGISMAVTIILLDKYRHKSGNNTTVLLITLLIFLPLLSSIAYYQEPFNIKRRARKLIFKEENSHILNETELELNDDGIINNDKESRVQQKWSSIIRYAVTKEYFYLYSNSMQAQIIPKRLFNSQKEIEEFDKFLTTKIPLSSSFRSMGI